MIKRIHVVKYRKLENMDLEFSKGINVISGTNGTCKTSLLHIVKYHSPYFCCEHVYRKVLVLGMER